MMRQPIRSIEDNRILTPTQKAFLRAFSTSELSGVYRLSGGTALSAFYLEHRLSDDLDFFSPEKIPFYVAERFLRQLDFVDAIHLTRKYDRNIFTLKLRDPKFSPIKDVEDKFVGGESLLKTEFTYYPLKNLEDVNRIASLQLDSFNDILVNKLCAVADRMDVKDYADVYCATKDHPELLDQLFHAAQGKCEISGIRHILQHRLLQIPEGLGKLNLKTEINPADMERFFASFVKSVVKKGLIR